MSRTHGSDTESPDSGGTAHLLDLERARCSFDAGLLREFVTGSRGLRASGFEPLFDGPPFDDKGLDPYLGYVELYEKRHERATAAMHIIQNNPKLKLNHQAGRVPMRKFVGRTGIFVHFDMFLNFLKSQGSKEQHEKWLDGAVNGRYLGAYAQTELGHGSNVRALETTATFDRETDEFVIHSPTLTSMKWWPTGIYVATHACVFARLVIDGKNIGFHGFMVQLRDDEGRCMPGVEVGEMGPKFDPEHHYIGYARFNQVRIPRFNMFAKSQQVTREGQYIAAPPKLSRLKYFTMMITRVALMNKSGNSLGRAATIAIRYGAVRRQGFKNSEVEDPVASGEHVVIDYRMQQYRTMKALALTYMFVFNSKWLNEYLKRVQQAVHDGDEDAADELPELHATTSGLKVWSTLLAHDGMEDMRRACGGQGFLRSSGLGDLFTEFGVAVTGEGEQVILSLQVARFLIKAVEDWKGGRPVWGSVKYLEDASLQGKADLPARFGRPEALVDLLRDRARRFAIDLERRFTAARASGMSFDDAINAVAVPGYKAAQTHCVYVFMRNFRIALPEYVSDPACRAAVERLEELLLLQFIREEGVDWVEALDYGQLGDALDRIHQLLDELRPDSIGLVDGLGHSDQALGHSTLGRYDGNVYEAIYETARLSPLNTAERMVGWEHFAKVLDLDFLRDGMQLQRCTARSGFATGSAVPSGDGVGSAPLAASAASAKL